MSVDIYATPHDATGQTITPEIVQILEDLDFGFNDHTDPWISVICVGGFNAGKSVVDNDVAVADFATAIEGKSISLGNCVTDENHNINLVLTVYDYDTGQNIVGSEFIAQSDPMLVPCNGSTSEEFESVGKVKILYTVNCNFPLHEGQITEPDKTSKTDIFKSNTVVSDPNTVFHRLIIEGGSDDVISESNVRDEDNRELKDDIENGKNHADGSTITSIKNPNKTQLQAAIDKLKQDAEPNHEVLIHINDHGGKLPDKSNKGDETKDEFIWTDVDGNGKITTDEMITDDEFAKMLQGFRNDVTLTIVIGTCYGGGFGDGTDDIEENENVTVIGASGVITSGRGFNSDIKIESITEAIADGIGEKEADFNNDGKVTSDELKEWLRDEKGYDIGPSNDSDPELFEENDDCVLPPISNESKNTRIKTASFELTPLESYAIQGFDFEPNSNIELFIDTKMIKYTNISTGHEGSFIAEFTLPDISAGAHRLTAVDKFGNEGIFDVIIKGKHHCWLHMN